MSFVDVPLTPATAVTSWLVDVPTLVVVAGLAGGYWWLRRAAARRGAGVGHGRAVCFLLLGCAVWLVAACSFIGVYADTLFWVRALQVVLLLFVVPFGLALGKPVSVLRGALGEAGRVRVEAVLGGRIAHLLTYPATVSLAMLAAPWLLYLTPWYTAVLENRGVDQLTRLLLVAIGFGYFYSRLQVDPVPRRFSQLVSLGITVVEVLGDGLLGIVIWLGPLIAAEYYQQFHRSWGPDLRTDQAIGAGILWLLGDVIGIPFLLVLMRAFSLDDRAQAAEIDAELDDADRAVHPEDGGSGEVAEPAAPAGLWWENDPQLQERFHRG